MLTTIEVQTTQLSDGAWLSRSTANADTLEEAVARVVRAAVFNRAHDLDTEWAIYLTDGQVLRGSERGEYVS